MRDGSSPHQRAGTLALVGGGELARGNEPHDAILVSEARGGPAYVLATAAARQRPDLAVATARRWFGSLGLDVEELPAIRPGDVRSVENIRRARGATFFYLVGGDPGFLTSTLDATPLWDAVAGAWRAGAVLAGSSAGAMAFGEWTLLRAGPPGTPRRRFAPALRLVPGVAVVPHLDSFGRRWLDAAVAHLPRADGMLLGLDERTAAVWRRGAWLASGAGGVEVVTAAGRHRRFAQGEHIEGLPEPA
jgi:cyanophycinase